MAVLNSGNTVVSYSKWAADTRQCPEAHRPTGLLYTVINDIRDPVSNKIESKDQHPKLSVF